MENYYGNHACMQQSMATRALHTTVNDQERQRKKHENVQQI